MTTEQVFSFCSTLVLPGWLLLVFFPRWRPVSHIITGIIVTVLALVYAFFIFTNLQPADMQSFSSLKGVMALFTNEQAVLAGWIHYLAFDLITGLFEVRNAEKHSISQWLLVPCLFFTFMPGPVGLLLYFIIRSVKTRELFPSNG